MDIESFRSYCLKKKGVTEEFPFDQVTLVFKVMGKIFALTNVDTFGSISLKCEPQKALKLREDFEEVTPGYHMNKKHWNTVAINGRIGDRMLKELIDHSYQQVIATLPRKLRSTFNT